MKSREKKKSSFLKNFFVFLSVVLVGFYFYNRSAEAAWLGDSWRYRVKLTIDQTKVDADLTDFPVYVDLANLPSSFHQNVNRTDGRDIRVTKGDGTTELPREVSFYDYANRKGELHFKYSGTLSGSTDTVIYIYYGNPSASDYAATDTYGRNNVWDSSTVAAWHMSETTGHHTNSTSTSSIDSTVENVTQKGAYIGKLGRADEFSGTSDDVQVPSSSSFRQAGDFTISAWVKVDTLSSTLGRGQAVFYRHLNASPFEEYGIYINHTNDKLHFTNASVEFTGGTAIFNTAVSTNTWYHVVGVKSGTNMKIYVNGTNSGAIDGSYVGTYPNLTGDIFIGDYDTNNAIELDGVIDEVRLASTARSATWISTEYNNQNSPSTFFSTGAVEEQKGMAILNFKFDEGYGTTTKDSSSNALTGTLTGATTPSWQSEDLCVSGKCLYYQGSTAYTNVAISVPNVQSVSFWVKPKTNSETLVDFDGGTHYISASGGTITATGFATPTVYVNGKSGGALVANVWQHVEVTTATAFTASNITIGKRASTFLNGFIDEFKVYDYARSASQVKTDFNSRNSSSGIGVRFGPDTGNTLSSALVGYWKMEESATPSLDSSGNGQSGTWNGNTAAATGKYGNGASFDGTGDSINISDNDSFSVNTTNQLTVSTWFKADTVSVQQEVVSKGTGSNYEWAIRINTDGTLRGYVYQSSGSEYLQATNYSITAGVWYHVVMVIRTDTPSVNLYVDGVSRAEDTTSSGSYTNGTAALRIGERADGLNDFDGTVDEVRIYNRALSSAEVGQLYNWAPGPVGYWNMDENTGQAVNDKSGTGNNATLGTTSSVSTDDPSWSIGKFGSGLLFDGSTDLVRADDSDSLSFGNGTTDRSFTMSGWINPTVGTSQYVFTKFTEYEMRFGSDGRLICSQQDASTGGYIGRNWSGPVSTNTWFHVSCTYDGSATSAGTKIYVNGVRVDNANEASGSYVAMENTTNSFRLADALFTGRMDDMKVYNYVRSPAQVIEDMNGGRPASSSFSPVAYWKLDDATGTTASDASGNSLNLTLSTASWTSGGKFQSAWNGEGARWLSITDANTSGKLDFAAADDFTISMWMKSDSASNPVAVEYLLSKAESTAGYRMFVENDGTGSVSFGIDDDASWTPGDKANSVIDVYDGAWHNIVAVKQGTSKIQLFVDGNLKQEDTAIAESGTLENSITMYLGDRNGANEGDEFFGDLDEVKIFRSALTAEQIKLLYNQSAGSALGALSTDSLDVPSNSSTDEHCPPGQGSTCTPPILYWKLDENTGTSTTNDSSTNGYTGTLNGSMTNGNWVTGKLGSALNFDGVDDSVQNTSVSPPTGDFTYEAWIYPTTFATSNPIFGIPQASIGGNELMVDTDTDGDIDVLLDNGALLINGTNGLVAANSWSHIAVTRIGSTVTTYINGKRDGTGTDADALSIAPCGIRIGRSQTSTTCSSGGSALFAGRIDDVKVYDYGRTAAQVAWDYNRGKPVAWWKMDENTGSPSTINDSAGNSLSGTATGTMDSTDWVSGKLNTALDFDGSDDVVTLTNSSPIDLNTGLFSGFTFSTWIYPNTVGETAGRIFQKGTNGSTTDASTTFCRITGSSPFGVECNLDLATSDAVFSVSSAAPANQWTHIAFSWTNDSDDEVTIWVNGNPKTSTASYDGDPSAESNSLYVAGNGTTTSNTRAFDGQIDDFRIYNFELSAQQIKSAMNDGAVRVGPATGTP